MFDFVCLCCCVSPFLFLLLLPLFSPFSPLLSLLWSGGDDGEEEEQNRIKPGR